MGKLRNAHQGLSGASKQQSGDCLTQTCPDVKCNKTVPPAPATIIGTCDYYTWREQNFRDRHVNCGHTPPTYYLNYGYKYCVKFSTELYPRLSPEGQAWLIKARTLLQVYMERGLQKNMALELDSDKFKKFAFDTHPDAYWDAGFARLSYGDMYEVGRTPDWREWKDGATWSQAEDIFWRQAKHDARSATNAAQKKVGEIADFFRDLFK